MPIVFVLPLLEIFAITNTIAVKVVSDVYDRIKKAGSDWSKEGR